MNCGKQGKKLEITVRKPTMRQNAFVKMLMFDTSFAAGQRIVFHKNTLTWWVLAYMLLCFSSQQALKHIIKQELPCFNPG